MLISSCSSLCNHSGKPFHIITPSLKMLLLFQILLPSLFFSTQVAFAFGQSTLLPPDEVEALREIGRSLGKSWDFGVDPCSGLSGWMDLDPEVDPLKGKMNAVICNCSSASNNNNNKSCHVVSIVLRAQNLMGSVPPEIVKLPFLREMRVINSRTLTKLQFHFLMPFLLVLYSVLSRNYLNGTIPPEWGSTKLVNISLLGNRVSGSIPKELGNITTLGMLNLEGNQLYGTIPAEFGNLHQLEKLILTSNNLTGEIPKTLENLSALKDFRISDNNFMGRIPNFIQNWKNIEKLAIQASGLTGPIPPGISLLTKLKDLKISDLSGNESTLPHFTNTTDLKYLMLRSCNIVGKLPSYIGDMTRLKLLDLSYNKFSGFIPASFARLADVDYIYLTGNSLTGPLPRWMLTQGNNIDLSYNNLTSEASEQSCQLRDLNLFASSKGNTSGIVSCLRSIRCEKRYSSLHINCGGRQVVDDEGTIYEADTNPGGPSNFYLSKTNWGFSSTGIFTGDEHPTSSYIGSSKWSVLGPNSQLYTDARLSPLSLTYYSFCLLNGNYTVILHFTKIMVTDDDAYSSLGRRVFDVYIQGNRVLKDFKIENKVGGVNDAITTNFTVVVNDNTLDIRFYWAGRGTVSIPFRGVYGSLISAISVNPDFIPLESGRNNNISTGVIIGIVAAVLFAISLFLAILWWKCSLRRKDKTLNDLKDLELHVGSFTLREIKAATNNFDPVNKIGEGGFGSVYKGHLPNGTIVAVKQLSSKSKQGNREFVNELGVISALQHPHLVKLYGCSVEDNQLLLVYEYMENNSLARALFGSKEQQLHLDWPTRNRICIGIARGLAYLHGESRIKIVHRDIKATNVLLDKNLVPKLSDFGLAKLHEEDNTHISTRVAGTFGYMAPEYVLRGYLTDKADVYSFGVVLFEIISGRSMLVFKPNEDCFCLLDRVDSLKEKGKNFLELVDPRLQLDFNEKEVMTAINVALLCTNMVAMKRPSMSTVVSMLEGKTCFDDFVS